MLQGLKHSGAVAGEGAGVIGSGAYVNGQRVANIPIEEAGDWAKRPGHVVWIGLFEPEEELLERIQAQFDLNPLAIEDASQAHQRPKMETYGNSLFIVARTAQMVDGRVAFGETHLFTGRGYVVSVRHGASRSYASVRLRCEANPDELSHGEDFILYAILDFIVDNFMDVLEAMHEHVEDLEDLIMTKALDAEEIQRLYTLRRDLLRLRNAVVPLVDVCKRLETTHHLVVDDQIRHLFRDVTDHIRRVQEEIESLREVLAFAFEASLMIGQEQQTAISRKLSAGAAILAIPTAIAGLYGMNFKAIPGSEFDYGFHAVIGLVLVICGYLFWRFRKAEWI
jgi:magnesium transporter